MIQCKWCSAKGTVDEIALHENSIHKTEMFKGKNYDIVRCVDCDKPYNSKSYRSCPSCKFDAVGRENTQGLIKKDLLLDD